jgi:protoporphyrinogen oxidase
MYAARHSGHKQELFGYLPGGYARMLKVFREKLLSLGIEIKTSWRAQSIRRDASGSIEVESTAGEQQSFDRVVVTTPAPVAARLCPQLTTDESARLKSVEYLGIVCASLLLKKPLAGYYVTNITDPAPFTGVIEMTALVDPAQIGGHTLVYLPKYATADDPVWSRTDDQIQAEFLAALGRLYPDFSPADVLAFRISRVRQVFALSTLDYSRRVPPIATSVPGLWLVNSSQIINGTLNVNETMRLAEASLASLCAPIETTHPSLSTTHSDDQAAGELVARPG